MSRWRWIFPDDAGIGATPQRCAQAASDRMRCGLSPAAIRILAATSKPTPWASGSDGAASRISGRISVLRRIFCSRRNSARRPSSRSVNRVVKRTTSGSERRGFNAAVVLTRVVGDSPMNRARISSGAVKVTWRIWLTTVIHSFAAERRATVRTLIASMLPVRDFGVPVAVSTSGALRVSPFTQNLDASGARTRTTQPKRKGSR